MTGSREEQPYFRSGRTTRLLSVANLASILRDIIAPNIQFNYEVIQIFIGFVRLVRTQISYHKLSKSYFYSLKPKTITCFSPLESPSSQDAACLESIVNFIMHTIFADNKINEQCSSSQQVSFRNIPISPHLPLRHSISPQKRHTSKKFFFAMRNQSTHIDSNPATAEIETLLKRQKVMLMVQKVRFNELLLTPDMLIKENDLATFPSLEVKPKPQFNRKQRQNPLLPELKLDDVKYQCYSNILGNASTPNPQTSKQAQSYSERKRQSPEPIRKSTIIPRLQKNQSIPDRSSKTTQKIQKKVMEETTTPTLSLVSRIKSQKQIEPLQPLKKFKKGYLAYEPGGSEYWEKIKQNWSATPMLPVDYKIVTAKVFYALDLQTLTPLVYQQPQQQIEIASVSKIMTCYLTLLIARKYEVDLKDIWYRVPDSIAGFPGTSAELQAGDIISAYDLLFALMLPSGNDASVCLAELMGKVIQRHRKKEQKKSYFQTFLTHMNLFSKELSLAQEWGNSHGLPNNPNISTAESIVALTALALKDSTFRMVINTREYEVTLKNDRYGLSNKRVWRNTNKLLQKGWEGVKTGTTDSAGHCLMALKGNILLGVFDCQTLSKRFTDSVKLYEYIISHPKYR